MPDAYFTIPCGLLRQGTAIRVTVHFAPYADSRRNRIFPVTAAVRKAHTILFYAVLGLSNPFYLARISLRMKQI